MKKQDIIDKLYTCVSESTRFYASCQLSKNRRELQLAMALALECANDCRITGELLEENSEQADMFLHLCGEICGRCATECDRHPEIDNSKKCAEICHYCCKMCISHEPVN